MESHISESSKFSENRTLEQEGSCQAKQCVKCTKDDSDSVQNNHVTASDTADNIFPSESNIIMSSNQDRLVGNITGSSVDFETGRWQNAPQIIMTQQNSGLGVTDGSLCRTDFPVEGDGNSSHDRGSCKRKSSPSDSDNNRAVPTENSQNAHSEVSSEQSGSGNDLREPESDFQEYNTAASKRPRLERSQSDTHSSSDNFELQEYHINNLPRFLLIHIMSYFPMPTLLTKVCLVSKDWYELCQDPSLWRRLNLDEYKQVTDEILIKLTKLSDNVRSVSLADCTSLTDDGIVAMAKQCPTLTEFKSMRCPQLTQKSFCAVAECCPKLQMLNVSGCREFNDESLKKVAAGCPKLTHVRISACPKVSDEGLKELARCAPNLWVLTCQEDFKITDASIPGAVASFKQLQILCLHATRVGDKGIWEISKLKYLKSIDMTDLSTVSNAAIRNLVQKCTILITLNLCLCTQVSDETIAYIARYAKNLRNLYLVSCKVTDEALISVGKYSKSIVHMDVGWCRAVSDKGAISISEDCQQLTYLGLTRCDQVRHETVLDLVKKYPSIHYSTSQLDSERVIEKARKSGFNFKDDGAGGEGTDGSSEASGSVSTPRRASTSTGRNVSCNTTIVMARNPPPQRTLLRNRHSGSSTTSGRAGTTSSVEVATSSSLGTSNSGTTTTTSSRGDITSNIGPSSSSVGTPSNSGTTSSYNSSITSSSEHHSVGSSNDFGSDSVNMTSRNVTGSNGELNIINSNGDSTKDNTSSSQGTLSKSLTQTSPGEHHQL